MPQVVKTAFASRLTDCLRRAYKGQLPSIAVIARDFSLKSPHLPHVSGETIRKWLRGESLPHVSRMHVLIEWLGPEIASPFEHYGRAMAPQSNQVPPITNDHTPDNVGELLRIAQILTEKEYQSVLSIARLLADKHTHEQTPESLAGDGHLKQHNGL